MEQGHNSKKKWYAFYTKSRVIFVHAAKAARYAPGRNHVVSDIKKQKLFFVNDDFISNLIIIKNLETNTTD